MARGTGGTRVVISIPERRGKELQMSRITPFVLVLLCWSVADPAAADPLLCGHRAST